jgi:hypothetical protein
MEARFRTPRRAHPQRAFVVRSQTGSQRTNLLQRIIDHLGQLYGRAFDRMEKDCTYIFKASEIFFSNDNRVLRSLKTATGGKGNAVRALKIKEKGEECPNSITMRLQSSSQM